MRRSAERSKVEDKPLVLAASDGELYGHHKKFADLALAYAVSVSAPSEAIEVTNLGAYLAKNPPTWEMRLRLGPDGRGTAWSCAHGIGRWMRDCGCRMHDVKGSSQAWRGPLRKALDLLRDRSRTFFEEMAADLFPDPWQARNAYGMVADDAPDARKQKLRSIGRPSLRNDRGKQSTRALLLMEMQRSLLLMYASCAWFFDDIAGPEAAIALRRAAHAMDLWSELEGRPPTKAFLDILSDAHSNDRKLGNGADAYVRACKSRITPDRAVARSAFSCLATMAPGENQVPGFIVTSSALATESAPKTLRGKAKVTDRRNGIETTLDFSATHDGKADFECRVGKTRLGLGDLDDEAAQALRLGALVRMAADCDEAAGCKAVLEVADQLATCTTGEQAALSRLLVRALATFLEARLVGKKALPQTDWQVALSIATRAGTMQTTDDWHRVQEIVWEHVALLRKHDKVMPKSLRALAQRLELVKPDVEEPAESSRE
jgi:hypothetical protein